MLIDRGGCELRHWAHRLLIAGLFLLPAGTVAASERQEVVIRAATAREDDGALAHRLTVESLGHLRRGEDAESREEKLAHYREGLELARQAVALDESNADTHFALFGNEGRIMLLEGATPNPINLLKVNRRLERALELDPNHSDALAAKGGLYRQLPWLLGGDLQKAETLLTKAIAADPQAVGARIELAATYRDMGRIERCRPLLEKAADIAERQGKRRQLNEARQLLRELEAH